MPAVFTNRPSAAPRPTTLVSPVTTFTPARSAARATDSVMERSSENGSPSSMMKASDRATGVAPIMARSLTVPLTASSPMSPPGNASGLTTNKSVVKARRWPATSTTAASLSGPPTPEPPSAGAIRSRISTADSWPPEP